MRLLDQVKVLLTGRNKELAGVTGGPAEAPAAAGSVATPEAVAPQESPSISRSGYSAYGEDILAVSWFGHFSIDPSTITYMDVGAAHPWRLSNSFLLYQYGARGVLVEPDPDQAARLREARPRDVVIEAGAAFDERRTATFHRMTASVFNSFSDTQAEFVVSTSRNWQPEQRQTLREKIEVPLVPLSEIADAHFSERQLDFLSIDVESLDLPVLRQFNFDRHKPLVICVEAQKSRSEVDAILLPIGYIPMATTPDNFMFMRDPAGPDWVARSKAAA